MLRTSVIILTKVLRSCPCRVDQMSSAKGMRKYFLSSHAFKPFVVSRSASFSSVSSSLASQAQVTQVAQARKGPWDLYAGVIVERKPLITQKRDAVQEKYVKYFAQLEYELSKRSDHEVRGDNDKLMLEKVKSGEIDLGNVQTAQDNEDRWSAELQKFQHASRVTEADSKNDVKSLERALDSHLLLVVEQKLGMEYRWICPHSLLQEGENLRQAAERIIRDTFPQLKIKVLGNAPWGLYRYKYPPSSSDSGALGAKVFFYKAQVTSGESSISNSAENDIKDFLWLKRDELPDKLQLEYYKKVADCIIEE